MDILTEENTKLFIKKLQNYQSGRGNKKKTNFYVPEPRIFHLILNELKSDNILELERNSNACEQICDKLNIPYKGVYPGLRKRASVKEWDGDIICGPTDLKISGFVVLNALSKLKPGRFFAYYQKYEFMESWARYENVFSEYPFQKVYLTPTRAMMSCDKTFKPITAFAPHAWFVWFKDSPKKTPEIHWLDEMWDEYYVINPEGKVMRVNRERVYRKPMNVTLDLGIGKILTQ